MPNFEINEKYLKKSRLYKLKKNGIICLACRNYCYIPEGKSGKCLVRINKNNELYVPYGYVTALNIDPIEKKPLYHFLPGEKTLSFGMAGCNFKCDYCQNWEISQFLRDPLAYSNFIEISSEDIVNFLFEKKLKILVSTYNEPTITSEWSYEIFSLAKEKNSDIKTGFVSNGYISPENLYFLKDKIDFIKVDLKSFNKENYNRLTGANLKYLLESIELIYKNEIHIELLLLLVKDFNDSEKELEALFEFVKNISHDIPLHITAFHPDYNMQDIENTDISDIKRAINIAKNKGLKFVYGGNIISNDFSNTYCSSCGKIIIERSFMSTKINRIKKDKYNGFCPHCNYKIYGIF